MKPIINLFTLFSLGSCFGQKLIEPYALQISTVKTTNIIFSFAIKSVDRGSRDVLVQKQGKVLELKASKENFQPTNVTVTTSDGSFYSFIVQYSTDPANLNISFENDTLASPLPFLHLGARTGNMKLLLRSIYLRKGLLWFNLKLTNYSVIDFEPESIRFFITEKRRIRRTAVQENDLMPIYCQSYSGVAGQSSRELNLAFMPFSFDKGKRLVIECIERDGGRNLTVKVSRNSLLKAR